MEKDEVILRYFSDNERFADLVNAFGFKGRQVVSASDLTELDSRTGYHDGTAGERNATGKHPTKVKGGKSKYRDLIKRTAFGINFAIIGIENQDEIHYLMPVRCMGYDVREYERQATIRRKEVRKKKGISRAEFLSGFLKDDKLKPCVTFVLYYGEEKWDGSTDLFGMMDFSDIPEELCALVGNYRINLIDMRRIKNAEMFRTDLRQISKAVQCMDHPKKLKKLLYSDEEYRKMEKEAYDMLMAMANIEVPEEGRENSMGKEKKDACKALLGWADEARKEGRKEGRKEALSYLICACKELGATWDVALYQVVDKFKIDRKKAEEYMKMYW